MGTEAIAHTTSRDASVALAHLQQQLTRVTGVRDPRQADIEALGRALEAARTRTIKRERMDELSEALAAALATGTFEEVTLQRLSEDLYAALNNRALTREQGALVAVDVAASLTDLGVQQSHQTVVLNALQGVCPAAVVPAAQTPGPNGTTQTTPAKRSLLVLTRDSE